MPLLASVSYRLPASMKTPMVAVSPWPPCNRTAHITVCHGLTVHPQPAPPSTRLRDAPLMPHAAHWGALSPQSRGRSGRRAGTPRRRPAPRQQQPAAASSTSKRASVTVQPPQGVAGAPTRARQHTMHPPRARTCRSACRAMGAMARCMVHCTAAHRARRAHEATKHDASACTTHQRGTAPRANTGRVRVYALDFRQI